MKRGVIFLLFCSLAWAAFAQSSIKGDAESKIDSIYVRQEKMMGMQKELLDYAKDDPLENKSFGFEINPIRLLWLDEDIGAVSGTVSLFAVNRNAEIAFPFFISDSDDYETVDFTTLDCHYRYFLGRHQKGFYISAFARYAHLNGIKSKHWWVDEVNEYKKSTENKLGIGCGIGWRIFSHKGFYWGTSLFVGRYIIGENNCFLNGIFDSGGDAINFLRDNDNKFIFDFEFLKFGWAF